MKIKNHITLIPNGIETEDFSVIDNDIVTKESVGLNGKFVIGTLINVRKWKRIEIVIDAMKELREHNIAFLVIGSGQDIEYYKEYVKNKKLGDCVIFAGMQQDVSCFYKIMDLFILSSGKAEGFGNVVIEAMFFKKPVLIFEDLLSIKSYFEKDKEIFIINISSFALIQKIMDLINNPELLKIVGANGKDKVLKKYTMKNTYEGYKTIYEKYLI
jgi:glycosyltransferase involved in cell wall biosynthesis